jgi:hypothetical protein
VTERLGDAVLELTTDDAALNRGIGRARQAAEGLERRFEAVAKRMTAIGRKMTLAITAPLVAAATFALRESDNAVTTAARLSAAIAAAGGDVRKELPVYQEFASALQSITTVGDDTTLANIQIARSMGLSAQQAASAAMNAIGLAAAFGVNEQAAIKMTAALEQGETTLLNRYIPTLRAIKDDAERAAAAKKILANAFGVATAAAQAGLGPYRQMMNDLGDLGEQFGAIVQAGLNPFIQWMREAILRVQAFSDEAKTWVLTLAAVVGGLGPAALALGGLIYALKLVVAGFTAAAVAAARFTAAVGKTTLVVGGFAVAVASVAALMRSWQEGITFKEAISRDLADLSKTLNGLVGQIQQQLPKGLVDLIINGGGAQTPSQRIDEAFKALTTPLQRAKDLISSLPNIATGATAGGAGKASEAAKKIKEVVEALTFERDALQLNAVERRIAEELRAAGIDATHREAEAIHGLVTEIMRETQAQEERKRGFIGTLQKWAAEAGNLGRQIAQGIGQAIESTADALAEFAITGKANSADLAQSIAKMLLKIAIQAAMVRALLAVFPGLTPVGSAGMPLNILPGFAQGADFTVGGREGTDRNLVAFRATRGERVQVTPRGQSSASNIRFEVHNVPAGASFAERDRRREGDVDVVELVYQTVDSGFAGGRFDNSQRERTGVRPRPIGRG